MSKALPFLPEPDPLPAKPKSNRAKTLVLWVLLMVLFLAIWQFLSPSPGAQPAHPSPPPCTEPFWSTALTSLLPAAFIAFPLFWFFYRVFRPNPGFHRELEAAHLATAEGRFEEAAKAFVAAADNHSRQPAYCASAMSEAAHAQMLAGRLGDALETYKRVERSGWVPSFTGLRVFAAVNLAFAHALLGDVAAADTWAAEARARLAKNTDSRMGAAAYLCFAEAVAALRRGQAAETLALLDTNLPRLRYSLTTTTMRAAQVVRAFAESSKELRAYNVVSERLLGLDPVTPGEFAYLGAKWPEMKTFLGAHGLDRP